MEKSSETVVLLKAHFLPTTSLVIGHRFQFNKQNQQANKAIVTCVAYQTTSYIWTVKLHQLVEKLPALEMARWPKDWQRTWASLWQRSTQASLQRNMLHQLYQVTRQIVMRCVVILSTLIPILSVPHISTCCKLAMQCYYWRKTCREIRPNSSIHANSWSLTRTPQDISWCYLGKEGNANHFLWSLSLLPLQEPQ